MPGAARFMRYVMCCFGVSEACVGSDFLRCHPLRFMELEFGGEFHQFLYRELPEGFAGDSGVTAEIIYLRPIGGVNLKFLHQLECDAPATLEFISRSVHAFDGDAEVGIFLPGHLLEGVGAPGSVLQHKLTLCLVRLAVNGELMKGGVEPPEVSYLLCHVIDRFC